MRIILLKSPAGTIEADLLAFGCRSPGLEGDLRQLDEVMRGELGRELARRRFSGHAGTSALLPLYGVAKWRNVLIYGLGATPSPVNYRLMASAALEAACSTCSRTTAVAACGLTGDEVAALAEGAALSGYQFCRYKSQSSEFTLDAVTIVYEGGSELRAAGERGLRMAAATNLARDLINTPAADATPESIAAVARETAQRTDLECVVHDRKAIERLGMGALLGVAQASPREPRFIEMVYRPDSGHDAGHVALVGKGITFDSGGLSLKNPAAMEEQKRDMAGAAIMLAVMSELRTLGIAAEIRAYLPCTENMPGPAAIKPGDVLQSRAGKTIEVLNTDAEGRLVLADAIAYACEFSPRVLIDAGTLTAAVRAALGTRVGAVLGTDPVLVEALRQAGAAAGERLWELPLIGEYAEELRSNVADLRNIGTSGNAGTIICALFLKEFVTCQSWAHLDLSGVSYSNRAAPLAPAGAVGFGVRTLLRYLLSRDSEAA